MVDDDRKTVVQQQNLEEIAPGVTGDQIYDREMEAIRIKEGKPPASEHYTSENILGHLKDRAMSREGGKDSSEKREEDGISSAVADGESIPHTIPINDDDTVVNGNISTAEGDPRNSQLGAKAGGDLKLSPQSGETVE